MKNIMISQCNKNVKNYLSVFSLALPVIIENILQVFLGTADTYFVGKLNSIAIAGIGVTNLIMNIYITFFIAAGVGTTAVVSRYIGMNDVKRAGIAVKQAIIFSVVLSLLVGLISLLFGKEILLLLSVKEEVLEYAMPYFYAVAVPTVFLGIMMILSSSLRGAGDTKSPMIAAGLANIINIVLNYLLIFGFWKFDGLGILGAGIATTISRIIAAMILLFRVSKKRSVVEIELLKNWKIDKNILRTITKIGIPAGLEKLFMRMGQVVYGSVIISLGTSSYVAHSIAGTIESYSYLPAMGFGVAATTLVGQNLGANQPEEAKRYGILSNILSTIMMVVIGTIFYIFAPYLAKLFTSDLEIQRLVVSVLRIIAFFQPLLSLTIVISSALQGAGDTKFPMFSTLIGIWGVRVCFGYIFAVILKLGLVGIWLAYSFDVTIRGIILLVRFISGKWQNIEID